jgi:hypothetical protein
MVEFLNFVIGFVVSLLIGAFGIYVGARVIADRDDYEYAILTALVGALVWWVVAGILSIIPIVGGLVGSVLGLLAWVYVINARYPGGWGRAIAIGLIAYLTVWVVLVLLSSTGLLAPDALGVPGL